MACIKRKDAKMKEGIHPEYKKIKIKCVCGNEIETGSTEENIKIEICNACHPLFTGQQKIKCKRFMKISFFKKKEEHKCAPQMIIFPLID